MEAFVRIFEKVYSPVRGADAALADVEAVMAKLPPVAGPDKPVQPLNALPTRGK